MGFQDRKISDRENWRISEIWIEGGHAQLVHKTIKLKWFLILKYLAYKALRDEPKGACIPIPGGQVIVRW
jgi:hypothetical protein